MNIVNYLLCFLLICLLLALGAAQSTPNNKILKFNSATHEAICYSQGLFFLNDTHLFESCGMYGLSYIHVLQYTSNKNGFTLNCTYQSKIPFQKNVFLEGSTLFKDKIYMLTWREKIVYVLNKDTFEVEEKKIWPRQGWGLTNNDTHLFLTDGSDTVFICDQNLKIIDQKKVIDQNNRTIRNLNELEYIDGLIWMNVYLTNRVLVVNPNTGKIQKEYDATALSMNEPAHKMDEVLNGIAHNKNSNKFIMTGKYWNYFYELELN